MDSHKSCLAGICQFSGSMSTYNSTSDNFQGAAGPAMHLLGEDGRTVSDFSLESCRGSFADMDDAASDASGAEVPEAGLLNINGPAEQSGALPGIDQVPWRLVRAARFMAATKRAASVAAAPAAGTPAQPPNRHAFGKGQYEGRTIQQAEADAAVLEDRTIQPETDDIVGPSLDASTGHLP
mmetsp:Transcript_57202/g.177287  ORF Transcript_57202/g.177287 Transcript_57202/m.177287 type:complete len:181 (-) Transcript_57202:58-600(-)